MYISKNLHEQELGLSLYCAYSHSGHKKNGDHIAAGCWLLLLLLVFFFNAVIF